jgi:Uma2 family endonuclease
MASAARVGETMTLEEFLRLPGIDERPYKEFIGGEIEVKPYLGARASVLMSRLTRSLSRFAEPQGLGEPFISFRCAFAGRSVVAAIAFLGESKIGVDEQGLIVDDEWVTPDLYVEFSSPEEPSDDRPHERLAFATSHGCPLGWLIDAERRAVHVYRPGQQAEHISDHGILEGDPVLPGYRLPVAELFGWLKMRRPGQKRQLLSPRSGSPTDGGPGQ